MDKVLIATGHYARIARENGRYLLKKRRPVTAGQAAVLYDGDIVLVGGTISTVYTEE